MTARPICKTTGELTIVTCDQQGATKLPMHPLYLQLPFITKKEDGDSLYDNLASKEIEAVTTTAIRTTSKSALMPKNILSAGEPLRVILPWRNFCRILLTIS